MHGLRAAPWTHLLASVCGGVVVAGVLIALGYSGRHDTQTVLQRPVIAGGTLAGDTSPATLQNIYRREAPGVVQVRGTASGSGFLVSSAGYILTSYELVAGTAHRPPTVQFGPGVLRQATLAHSDPDDDLALLRVDMRGVTAVARPLPLGSSAAVQVGDPALTLADPYGIDRTLSSGIVSALQRQLQTPDGSTFDDVIQTGGGLSSSGSGAPLLDTDGRVIGVMSDRGRVAFAIPIDTARTLLPRTAAH